LTVSGLLYRTSVRESLQTPFTELAERWHQKSGMARSSQGTSNPAGNGSHNHTGNDSHGEIGANSGHPGGFSRERRMKALKERIDRDGKRFRHSTLEHLVHPSSCLEAACGVSSRATVTDPSLHTTPKKRQRLDNMRQSVSEISETVGYNYPDFPDISMDTNTGIVRTDIEELTLKLQDLKDGLVSSSSTSSTQSLSFTWLLDVCSTMIESDVDPLLEELAKIEVKLLTDSAQKSERSILLRVRKAKKK